MVRKPYYYNCTTLETTWDFPSKYAAPPSPVKTKIQKPVVKAATATATPDPAPVPAAAAAAARPNRKHHLLYLYTYYSTMNILT